MSQDAANPFDFQPESSTGGAPTGATPNSGSATTPPSRPPVTALTAPGGAATTSKGGLQVQPTAGTVSSAGGLDFQPEATAAAAPLDPGGFGPYHESEAHLFFGPTDKGFNEGLSKTMGFHSPSDNMLDMFADTWDNIKSLGPEFLKRLHAAGARENEGLPLEAALPRWAQPGTPAAAAAGEMAVGLGKGILDNFRETANELAAGLDGTLDPSMTQRQHMGRAMGGMLGAIIQIVGLGEGGDIGEGLTKKAGEIAEKHAPRPGNALLHVPAKTILLGKDPGSFLSDPRIPMKIPLSANRLDSLENLRGQTASALEVLHGKVTDLLKSADTKRVILQDGTVRQMPNLLDPYSEIENAAEEVKRGLQKQKGIPAPQAKAIVREIDAVRDDMLHERDIQGNVVKTYPQQGMTPTEVNELKRAIGGRADYTKVFTDSREATKAAEVDKFVKIAYRRLNTLVDDSVGGAAGAHVKDLNELYSNGIEARKLLDLQVARESGTGGANKFARKGEWYGAAAAMGSAIPQIQALGAIEAMLHAGRTVQGRIARARGYAAVGRVLQSPAARAAGTAAGAAAGTVPTASGAAARVLSGADQP